MTPLPHTAIQNCAIAIVCIAAPLVALAVVTHSGFSWDMLVGAVFALCACCYGLYRTRRSPFAYRVTLRFLALVSSFAVIILVFSFVRQ